ncbi:MGDG synthase family glycosyltransferase [Pectinatus sottacetonis]|uniref:MGDG synthase family glycosyltransferase n=1 Tax=Pectinatus sottacetonis TaxID=1002795 RepID=UPI0018C5E05F
MTNILILTASVGNGHNKAAQSLREKFTGSGCDAVTVDFLETSYNMNKLFCNMYKQVLQHKPILFRSICQISENNKIGNIKYLLAAINSGSIGKIVGKYSPDVIICTHFFPLAAAAAYRKKYKAQFKLFAVVTDYVIHSVWQIENVDKYFIGHRSLCSQFGNNIRENDVIASGIPVGRYFLPMKVIKVNKKILVMTSLQSESSMMDIINIMKKMPCDINVIFITGHDIKRQQMLRHIAEHNKNFTIIGFTDQVASFMKNSDLIITKPGGITISEALAVGIPLLAYSPIPGIEESNAEFLQKNNLGYWAKNKKELYIMVQKFIKELPTRKKINKKMLQLKMSKAAEIIKDDILDYLAKKNKVA